MKLALSPGGARALFAGIAVILAVAEFLPLYTGGYQHEVSFLATHVATTTAMALLAIGILRRRTKDDAVPWHDVALALIAIASAGYFVVEGERIAQRIEGVDAVFALDYVFGLLLIAVLIEACRRVAGLVLAIIAVLFIVYVFVGPYMPGPIAHRGLSLKRFIDLQVLSTSGIFGTPISASAHMVFYFVVVGAFLEHSGAGKLFVDLAYGLTARASGGAGKAAVVSSGLIGTVSGSAVANVLLSGLVTIPLMKRTGFNPTMAGAIEATASTGGQLAPPIMGAAAFVLADIVGVPYADVALAAVIPALLYYVSLFMLVHFYSLRNGLRPDRTVSLVEQMQTLRTRWHLLVPLVMMVYLLISQYSLMTVGVYTTLLIIALSMLSPETRMGFSGMFKALIGGARSATEVAVPSAVAGIIVGTLVQTGMALKMQRWLLDLAEGSLAISLAGAMILTIILGMGMPTTAAYLVSAILVAPALQELGVPALPAHLFIFYFGILSMVTPPVALSAYAAAGISGANLWNTGLRAFLLAVPGFLIPYAFVMDPALILMGTPAEIVWVTGSALIGVIGLAAALAGYAFGSLPMPLRCVLALGCPLLIDPGLTTDVIGFGAVLLVVCYQLWRNKLAVAARAQLRE